ncbi:putative membrane protein YeiB [Catenulispora sp. EB89]|uniref:DUF418 domain-containing protein n=1 Tax=Catenulispora sp. EB89 TaxID=3156257 RepID=UPI0035127C04
MIQPTAGTGTGTGRADQIGQAPDARRQADGILPSAPAAIRPIDTPQPPASTATAADQAEQAPDAHLDADGIRSNTPLAIRPIDTLQPPESSASADQAERVTTAPSTTRRIETTAPVPTRLIGLDLARALAVFGMFAAHVGPDPSVGGPEGALMLLSHGRASALFALLAGASLAIIAGRRAPRTGAAGRQAVARIVIRASLLLALGVALTAWDPPVEVILAYYGVYFLLALPLLRLHTGTLAAIAMAWALAGPQLSYLLRATFELGDGTAGRFEGPVALLLTGGYPALTWMPFVIAGMALARLDLSAATVLRRLTVLGAGLTAAGYGLSWLVFRFFPHLTGLVTLASGSDGENGTVPTDSAANLLVASPHSGTTFEVLGNTGFAILTVVGSLALLDRLPRARRLLAPVITVGTMSLTVYVGHLVGISVLGIDDQSDEPLWVLLGFMATAVVFASLWSRRFRRGPLEYLLNAATKPAAQFNRA